MFKYFAGIDVSKDTLDVCVLPCRSPMDLVPLFLKAAAGALGLEWSRRVLTMTASKSSMTRSIQCRV